VKSLLNASLEEIQKQVFDDRVSKRIRKRKAKVSLSDFDKFKAWAQRKGL